MPEFLLAAITLLLILILVLQIAALLRKRPLDVQTLASLLESIQSSHDRIDRSVRQEVAQNREELANALKNVADTLFQQLRDIEHATGQHLERLRETVSEKLTSMQNDNNRYLERIRATVDEQLHGALERRLGESFKLVSERLEQVYRGLGEMQSLAVGVGDLKRALTNVKTRGTWGEVQLGALLQDVLLADQYAANVSTKGAGERVEFAVKLPGAKDNDEVVWLPIDAKFPMEDYLRLLDAYDKADAQMAEAASKQLETRVRQCAADIANKYLNPPVTTDFAILFLPTEGLFAEAMRRSGLADSIQREYRVVIAGPTTLWAILNSIQMGFRSLAVQKRSTEVWRLLAAVKTEWAKYQEVLERVLKKLNEASRTVEKAKTQTDAISRKLRQVEELPRNEARDVLDMEESSKFTDEDST
ncbi:MAG: DNA recombination protein RmuC [Desulfomonilaceae bacterium]